MAVAGLRALAGLIAMLGLCSSIRAADALIHFDLPREPLEAALTQYHALTGRSLLYDDAIAEGTMAGPVQGWLTPEAALQSLLAGSGIVAHYTSEAAFMLVRAAPSGDASALPLPPPTVAAAPAAAAPAAHGQRYYGALQAAVVAALCSHPATLPGRYRLALNLWVTPDGVVDRVLLHPTGDARRDARIRSLLSGLALQASPPPELAQPLTLVILPRAPAQTGDCEALRP